MRIPYYQVNAFTRSTFGGNPAGVCLLEQWLPDELLQQLAAENNLSETAFLVERQRRFELRWFTPATEVDLCGHATLAPAFVLFTEKDTSRSKIEFETRSGRLSAEFRGGLVHLDFPSRPGSVCPAPDLLVRGLGASPLGVLKSRDYLAVYDSEQTIAALKPDMGLLSQLDALGVIVTAPGEQSDFVSRFFAPRAGVPEDPVTGSSHCTLIPYWARRLKKKELFARQISRRGGEIYCQDAGDRVGIGGEAVIFERGELDIPELNPEVSEELH